MALSVAAAYAQSGAASDGDFTRQEIESFARASLAVERINEQWAPRMQDAETQEEMDVIRQQATEQMAQAIEAEGLDVTTYTEIIELAQQDPELTERIMRYREAVQ